ncbi:BTAD domain-containing putative transcriptional regulator [Streptomyces sp. NPDC060223]|uniref:BTAD domain-containing putative transcriptional regulator n=1 Tax=unclassified Streptomyces TaxID=2593676 RepID=UPI0036400E08
MGRQIHSLRRRSGLSQSELAARSGMSTRALRDIERGRVARPQLRTIQRLVAALELSDGEAQELYAADRTTPTRNSARFRVNILGTLSIHSGDTDVPVNRPMLRRLLGLLVLKQPHSVTHEEIVDTLWPTGPPRSSQSLVHTYVSQVRQLLEPAGPLTQAAPSVERVPGGYRLRAEAGQSDLGRFRDLVARAKRTYGAGDLEIAHQSLALALQCWRGPVLSDVDPLFRQHPSAVLAAEQRVEATLLYADLSLTVGRPEQAVPVLWETAGGEPLHEGVHARLMLALAGSGEQAAALNVYAFFRERLDEQLGITPSQELREAHLRVLRQQVPQPERPALFPPGPTSVGSTGTAAASAPSAPAATPVKPSQLPAGTSSYVGREREKRELDGLLGTEAADGVDRADGEDRSTVMAVVGPPGVGKTALALHWAHVRQERFEDGHLFVDLRGHSPLPALEPADVLARFLRALGVPPDRVPAGEEEAAAMYRTLLAGRRMLIVLDNAGSADQVRPLLPGPGRCRVVITSRSRLPGLVAGEGARHLGLEVLSLSEAHTLVGRILGEERAAAEPEAVVQLARLCGWLPLALRVAAANLIANPVLSVAGYCTELAGGDLIGGLRIEGDERSTVRAAFDLSYLALSEGARRTFRLLSLVPGSDITVPGAAALIDDSPAEAARLLRRLAHSHLVIEPTPGRFGMHDLLRSYARELADGEETEAVRRLLDWQLARTESAAELLYPDDPARFRTAGRERTRAGAPGVTDTDEATEWLTTERENLVSMVQYAARTGIHTSAWRLAEALHGFLSVGLHRADRLAVARDGLAAAVADGDLRAQSAARLRLADCHWAQGRNAHAVQDYGLALDLAERAGWGDGQAMALRRIGAAHQENGAMRQASLFLSRARGHSSRGTGPGAAEDLVNLGLICWKLGRLQEAVAHYTQAARIWDELDSTGSAAIARTNLGVVHRAMGRPAEAITLLDRALVLHARSGNKTSETVALSCLSTAHSDTGDHVRGLRLAQEAVASAQALQNRRLSANAWFSMGAAQERAGRPEAADSYRLALHLAGTVDDRFPQASALLGLATLALRQDEPEEALAHAGQALALAREAEFGVLEACARHVLALARVLLGDSRAAVEEARRALEMHRRTGHRPGEARSHMVLGCAFAARGEPDRAFGHRRKALLLFRQMGIPDFRDFAAHGRARRNSARVDEAADTGPAQPVPLCAELPGRG